MKKNFIILVIFILLLSSCTSIADNNQVKVYFIENGKLQYFFPPRLWDMEKEGFKFKADWLFRTFPLDGEQESRTIFNFSLIYDKLKIGNRIVSTVYLVADDGGRIEIRDLENLFKDHKEDRYTCWIPSSDYYEFIMNNEKQKIIIVLDGLEHELYPTDGVKNHIRYFKQVQPEFQ